MRALAAAVTLAASPALAEGFTNGNLGDGGPLDECLQRSRDVLEQYAAQQGVQREVVQGSWSTSAFDLPPQTVDVEIVCPNQDGVVGYAVIIGHNEGVGDDRVPTIQAIIDLWDAWSPAGAAQPVGK